MLDYTRLLERLNPAPGGEGVTRIRNGVVDAINLDGTLDVEVSGVVVPDVPRLESARPAEGDTVVMVTYLGQPLVIGVIASAPDRIPGERIATEIITSDSSTTDDGNELQVASITAAVVSGRTYRVKICGAIGSDTAGDRTQIHIREDNTSGNLIQNQNVYVIDTSSFGSQFCIEAEYTADATEGKTFVVTLELNNGTGPVHLEAASTRPAYLYVDYIRG